MRKLLIVIGLLACSNVFSSPSKSFWQDVANQSIVSQLRGVNEPVLTKRLLSLDEQQLKGLLFGNDSLDIGARKISGLEYQPELELPLPDGSFVRLRATDSPILPPQLAEQYPDIRTWRVRGIDDQSISGRLDFTSKGFHGMLTMPDGDTVFIDPEGKSTAGNLYQSLSKKDNVGHFKTDFSCKVHGDHSFFEHNSSRVERGESRVELAQIAALDLITYRLALAGTGEYTASQGGSAASAYASMVTTINRVNEIFQRDLGVALNLVSSDSLAYLDASTDPYTNNNALSLIEENGVNLDSVFGAVNFDIGHVFAQGNLGGLAYIESVCVDQAVDRDGNQVVSVKSGGATGISSPQGEIFSIGYVAHEMGHQLGANHTFNSQISYCGGDNRNAATAVEPGSGSTIMSYSGICASDNLQSHSDAQFHSVSINEINSHTRSLNNCGVLSSTGNQKPTANAGNDGIIPINTPFLLDGEATGGESYTWDQMDAGTASIKNVDTGDNAIIRTLLPASTADRFIPRLSDLFNGTTTDGESLPQKVRTINFNFVVRDGNGGVETDDKILFAKDTGATFSVLSHNSSQTILNNSTTTVSWNVAGTDLSPINCSHVDIKLLRVDGTMNDLILNTLNDGNEQFVVPGTTPVMSNARIMVACSNQPFFQISSGNITVQQGSGGDTVPPVITLNGPSSLSIVQGTSYTDAGATANDNIDGTVNVSTSGSVNTATTGIYTITYTATDSSSNTSIKTRTVTVTPEADTSPPVITVIGQTSLSIAQGTNYTDAGATAVDNVDGNVSVSTSGSVNTAVPNIYTITYTAIDSSNNASTKTRTVTVTAVADTTPPVITLNGSATISIVQGANYTDLGATAIDNIDGTVSVSTSGSVNTATAGVYTITYTATDASGNTSTKTRTVTVSSTVEEDTTPPVITINGSTVLDIPQGTTYTDAGATALDNKDGEISVATSGSVNTGVVATYMITYTATDSSGNTATEIRTVNVILFIDKTAPVISLVGASIIEVVQGTTYSDLGASAFDNIDKIVSVTSTGNVNTAVVGTYIITYTATDKAGNVATKKRTVKVVKKILPDNTAPVITLNGASSVSTVKGANYIELGATAIDDRDGEVDVVVSGVVDTSKLGVYNVTYTATDFAGNSSFISRTVNVVKVPDTAAPVITLEGETTIVLEIGQDYIDPGFAAFDDQDGIITVKVTGAVDINKAGTYVLTYTATDAAGNTLVKTRTIIVEKSNDGLYEEEASSGGGSFGYLLIPMMLLGLRRKKRLEK